MKHLGKLFVGLAFVFVLVGCNEEDVHEEISHHLEATVEIERAFEEHQEKIIELEKQDEELYNEIISLDSNSYEKVVSLAEEAVTLLDERYEEVKLEKQSLEESRVEFEKIEPLLEKISDSTQLERAEKMYETMMNRYDAYDDVYEYYSESIQLTKELYILFQEENFNENEVYALITTVNDSYDSVLTANEVFNKETVLYNNLKQEYYESIEE